MTDVTIIIPAAGASRRMRGRDKLLEHVDGMPLLRVITDRALALTDDVIVTLPELDGARAQTLKALSITQVKVADPQEGMAASLRAAAPHVSGTSKGVMVLPADMPDLTTADLAEVIRAFDKAQCDAIIQGTSADNTPGHPVVFPMDLVSEFAGLSGDTGARPVVQANKHRVRRVALPDNNAITDLDTPEAWDAWRKANPNR